MKVLLPLTWTRLHPQKGVGYVCLLAVTELTGVNPLLS